MEKADLDKIPEWMNIEDISDIFQEEKIIELKLLSVKYTNKQYERYAEFKQISVNSKIRLVFHQQ